MRTVMFTLFFFASFSITAQEIKWMDWEEAMKAAEKEPKLIFVDVYTDWCGWCKRMDATTFSHQKIAEYMNEKYYAVKFDAERTDTLQFSGHTFVNQNPGQKRSTHQLAQALLDKKMGYPKFVILNAEFERMSIVPGYHPPAKFEPIIKYFGENKQEEVGFEEYKKNFKGEIQ